MYNLELPNLDDILSDDNINEPLWEKLIEQIIDGNVIPVIGADMLLDNDTNLHSFIIDSFAHRFKVESKPHSFSELIFDENFKKNTQNKKDIIYYIVNKVFAAKRFTPSQKLRRLLELKMFPFVITTSFTPVVEDAMAEVWKDELRVMRFNNNPAENNDITHSTDLRKPTLYYMFGKVGDGVQKYVLTDIDMLNFVSSWLSNETRPKNLCNELRNKYLLMLGNNYSNWLFRFIWYSIRKPDLGRGMLAYDSLDDSLIHFLERTETFTMQNTSNVIDQICTRLSKKLSQLEETKFNSPQTNTDVFISYSRSDLHIAEQLYASLTACGKRVWFDKKNLSKGDKFMDEIRHAIRTARYFVPIFSKNIVNEKDESHVYRNEWDTAIDVAISMGRTYIIPIAENGFDFYKAAIPEKMQQHNAEFFSNDKEGITSVAESIVHKMNQA